jgi:protein-S-isoprenylcysteine O-methyltransferase Ste14
MYVGVLLILFGEALLFESATLFLYAVLAFVIFHTAVVYYEEPTLRRKFTDSYKRYCNSVPRWIPRLRQEE